MTLLKSMNMVTRQWNERLFTSIKDKGISTLKSEIIEIQKTVRERYLTSKFEELRRYLNGYKRFISAFKTTLDTDSEKIAYEMGRLSGYLSVYEEFLDEQTEIDAYLKFCSETKYSKEILEKLAKVDYMSHNQLAKSLDIMPCQLTNTMSRFEQSNQHMISFSKIGKFKCYYLTEMGKHYIKSRNKDRIGENIAGLLKKISSRIRGECDDTSLHDYINANYGEFKEVREEAQCLSKNINNIEDINHLCKKPYLIYSFYLSNIAKQKNTVKPPILWNDQNIMPCINIEYMNNENYLSVR